MPLVLKLRQNHESALVLDGRILSIKSCFIIGLDINLLRAELLFNIYSDSIAGVHKGLSLFVISCIFYE